jgi:anti-sigma regulatory factor (Ser/Thr protein kinase)
MSDSLSIELPIKPENAAWAREAVGEFRDHLDESSFIDLQLMVSELVADAVRAEAGKEQEIAIRIEARDRQIHVEVQEGAIAYRLRSRRPEPGEAGWGMYLIGMLADRWGTRHEGNRGCVWLQMRLAGAVTQV